MTEGYYRITNMKTNTDTTTKSGLTFQQVMLLNALRRQAKTGMLMTNPRVTGYTSFAKAVLALSMTRKHLKLVRTYIII